MAFLFLTVYTYCCRVKWLRMDTLPILNKGCREELIFSDVVYKICLKKVGLLKTTWLLQTKSSSFMLILVGSVRSKPVAT